MDDEQQTALPELELTLRIRTFERARWTPTTWLFAVKTPGVANWWWVYAATEIGMQPSRQPLTDAQVTGRGWAEADVELPREHIDAVTGRIWTTVAAMTTPQHILGEYLRDAHSHREPMHPEKLAEILVDALDRDGYEIRGRSDGHLPAGLAISDDGVTWSSCPAAQEAQRMLVGEIDVLSTELDATRSELQRLRNALVTLAPELFAEAAEAAETRGEGNACGEDDAGKTAGREHTKPNAGGQLVPTDGPATPALPSPRPVRELLAAQAARHG